MKAILLTTIFSISLVFSSLAQPTQGDYILGGSLVFNLTNVPVGINKRQSLSFSVAPSLGKFISEKFLISGGLGYSYRKDYNESSNQSFNESISNGISLNFGVTRFYPIVDKLFFTLGANVNLGYGFDKFKTGFAGVESSGNSRSLNGSIGISPGLTYFIKNRWMIYSNMGTINYSINHNITSSRTAHSINASLIANSFRVGVSYIFKGKEKGINN
jgi:hypothetical protein